MLEEMSKKSTVAQVKSLRISAYDSKWGTLTVHKGLLLFTIDANQDVEGFSIISSPTPVFSFPSIFSLPLSHCVALYKRTYCCQQSALELFFRRGGFTDSLYLFFTERKIRDNVYRKISLHLPETAIVQKLGESNIELIQRLKLDIQWQSGKLPNFDYLMQLNVAAGRSIQDITHYPVFPWILRRTGAFVDLKSTFETRLPLVISGIIET